MQMAPWHAVPIGLHLRCAINACQAGLYLLRISKPTTCRSVRFKLSNWSSEADCAQRMSIARLSMELIWLDTASSRHLPQIAKIPIPARASLSLDGACRGSQPGWLAFLEQSSPWLSHVVDVVHLAHKLFIANAGYHRGTDQHQRGGVRKKPPPLYAARARHRYGPTRELWPKSGRAQRLNRQQSRQALASSDHGDMRYELIVPA
ncbi:hypothetical protein GGD62_006221 [Bradyrhizobium sp. ERR14]|nr:hypothetical protein [Bradyrhizobium sp. ERR14]